MLETMPPAILIGLERARWARQSMPQQAVEGQTGIEWPFHLLFGFRGMPRAVMDSVLHHIHAKREHIIPCKVCPSSDLPTSEDAEAMQVPYGARVRVGDPLLPVHDRAFDGRAASRSALVSLQALCQHSRFPPLHGLKPTCLLLLYTRASSMPSTDEPGLPITYALQSQFIHADISDHI